MTPNQISSVIETFPEVHLKGGQCVFSQGQAAENFLLVTGGSVTVFARSAEGKEVVLYRVHEGEMCLLTTTCLIGHRHYPAEAFTDSETSARVIPAKEFESLLEKSPEFRKMVFNGLSERLSQVTQRFEHVVLESVKRRLAVFLLSRQDASGSLQTTHDQLAREVGTAREVVSRQLKTLETSGLIRTGRGRITILDPVRLSETG
ncbi:MAG: Crp/Fnr family transcriptional regulator [Xanthomonadales bacterium]|jgi:CRP/FNR family transcriptional regulator|nr:Crp/Fnr family transcriptional regulator [Xanthomonadales bacterium]